MASWHMREIEAWQYENIEEKSMKIAAMKTMAAIMRHSYERK